MARLASMDQLGRNGMAKLVSTVPFAEILEGTARPVSMGQIGRNRQTFGSTAKPVSTVPFGELLVGMARPVSMDQLGRNRQAFGGTAKPVSTVPFAELFVSTARLASMDQLGRNGMAKPVSTVPFAEILAGTARPVSMDQLGRNRQTFGGMTKLDSKVWWWYPRFFPPVGHDAMFGVPCMAIRGAMECCAQVNHEIHWHKAIPDSTVSLAMHHSKGRTRIAEKGLQMPVDLHLVFERGRE